MLGSAALLAACALKDWLAATGTPGRVRYYGCPAEEGGAAKAFMVRDRAFADVDAAITLHPSAMTKVDDDQRPPNTRIDFRLPGPARHSPTPPHLRRTHADRAAHLSAAAHTMHPHT